MQADQWIQILLIELMHSLHLNILINTSDYSWLFRAVSFFFFYISATLILLLVTQYEILLPLTRTEIILLRDSVQFYGKTGPKESRALFTLHKKEICAWPVWPYPDVMDKDFWGMSHLTYCINYHQDVIHTFVLYSFTIISHEMSQKDLLKCVCMCLCGDVCIWVKALLKGSYSQNDNTKFTNGSIPEG